MKKLLLIFIGVLLLILNFKLPKDTFEYDYSKVIFDKNGEILRVTLNKDEQFILPEIDDENNEIPEKLKVAVVFFEDKNFYKHFGVDISAIIRATFENVKNGEIKSGASTLTMQLSRIFIPKKRNFYNKVKETLHAFQIEIKYSKKEILKLYLNHAPYGGNIRGYRTASYKYFNKKAEFLTWAEAVTLAILPNAPSSLTTIKNREQFIKKRNTILNKLYEKAVISESDYRLSLREPLPNKIYSFPFEASHFSEKILTENINNNYIIRTTLDLKLQKRVENLVSSYNKELNRKGINNCAVLIADTRSREILSYIGSQNYFDNEHFGKIDGVLANRSTGSTLKPFLYGVSMDSGIISADSLLEDVPKNYGNFNPLNASRDYSGMVSAREALRRSLNVPAVDLLNLYGVENFYNFLKRSEISNLNLTASHYGLSMILGSVETSLWDLTKLYCSLGNYGEFSDFKYLLDQEDKNSEKLLSSGAAFLVLDILKGVEKGDDFKNFNSKIYWKTGTSFGQRDALAIGVNSNYTIGVWTGNFDGKSSEAISGIGSSAPLLFYVLNELEREENRLNVGDGEIFSIRGSLKEVEVTENYYSPIYNKEKMSEFKDYRNNKTLVPIEVKKIRKDPYQKLVYENFNDAGERVSTTNFRSIKTVYSNEVIHYLKNKGITQHLESSDKEINFLYPKDGMKVKLPKNLNGEYEKLKIEISDNTRSKVYFWFINKEFVQSSEENKIFISLESGVNKITVMNEFGDFKSIKINIIKSK